ncbi:MAG: hypothetical protein WCF23_02320 [Candidatus Nitrosopolaris sp.]
METTIEVLKQGNRILSHDHSVALIEGVPNEHIIFATTAPTVRTDSLALSRSDQGPLSLRKIAISFGT